MHPKQQYILFSSTKLTRLKRDPMRSEMLPVFLVTYPPKKLLTDTSGTTSNTDQTKSIHHNSQLITKQNDSGRYKVQNPEYRRH